MNVGFTTIFDADGVRFELCAPPAVEGSTLLSFARGPDVCAALMGRFYDREDRLADVRPRRPELWEGARADDAALARAIYLALGPEGLDRLEGDFALALWDARAGRLIGRRDPMGGYPLFWTRAGRAFAIGTGLGRLLEVHGSRRIDGEYLADFLAMFGQWGEGPGERCAYEGVSRVLPGSWVAFDVRANAVRRGPAWDWSQHVDDPGTESLPAIAGQYAERLQRAVGERARGPTLAHLSGGMDSTSVALLAGEWAAEGRVKSPVHTLSLVYDRLPKLSRERPFIEGVLAPLAGRPEFAPHRLPADDLLNYDGLDEGAGDARPGETGFDEPYAGLWCLQTARAMVEATARAGAATMLTGLGADELVDVQPYYLANLVRRGRWLRAWREAGRWAWARNTNAWPVLHAHAFTPLGWAGRRPWPFRRAAARDPALIAGSGAGVPPWVLDDFARRHDLAGRIRAAARRPWQMHGDATLSASLFALAHRPGDPVRWSVASPLGVGVAHPFLDTRVIALGLGALGRLAPDPHRMKPLLAEAMGGRLPAAITGRRAKGHFDELYYLGLARNRSAIERMVRAAPIEPLGLFDKEILLAQLDEAALAGPDARQVQRLDLTLSLVNWIGTEATSACAAAKPTEVIACAPTWKSDPRGREEL